MDSVVEMKEFRYIADEAMSDIKVGRELKERTLQRCMKKRHVPAGRLAVAAACLVLVVGILNISGLWRFKPQQGENANPNTIFEASNGEDASTMPGILSQPAVVTDWSLDTPDEAKTAFGDTFLIPAYIPGNYQLDEVHASGDGNNAYKVVLVYSAGEQSFLIIEEKSDVREGFVNYRKIEINGAEGYSKPETTDGDSSAGYLDTEVHWFKDGVHYSVSGPITEKEALEIAASMK